MIFLTVAFISAAVVYAFTLNKTATLITGMLNLIGSYLMLPTIAWGFYDLFGVAFFSAVVGLGAVLIGADVNRANTDKAAWGKSGGIILFGIVSALFVMVSINSSAIFHHNDYRALIGEVDAGTFSTETSPIDIEQIRVVDQKLAQRLGEKRLGEDPALGSKVELGEMNIQQINGRLYWAGMLNHSGFWKWWRNSSGTPGYIIVSATDPQDTRLIRNIDGEDINLRHNFGALFGDDPARHIYTSGYATVGLTDFTFEVDDNFRPYLVVTVIDRTISFGGTNVTGVVVLDVQTGDLEEYSIENAPDWIDRIQPTHIVDRQLRWWGEYVEGWFNFSDNNKLTTSDGMSLVYGNDGNAYWYTGLTSVGADESTVGFVLVDSRTKDVRRYNQSGATEKAAMRSAEGAVQEKEYDATFPILYNVGGRPTYFLTLKDNGGLVKSMAFVSVENFQIVGIGDNVRSAYRTYRRNLLKGNNGIAPDTNIDLQTSSGVVQRIRVVRNSDGMSQFYLVISSLDSLAFIGSPDMGPELILTEPGDEVTVRYETGRNISVDIMTFDNHSMEFRKTEEQIAVEQRSAEVQQQLRTERDAQNADTRWENMTDEEKAEFLRNRENN